MARHEAQHHVVVTGTWSAAYFWIKSSLITAEIRHFTDQNILTYLYLPYALITLKISFKRCLFDWLSKYQGIHFLLYCYWKQDTTFHQIWDKLYLPFALAVTGHAINRVTGLHLRWLSTQYTHPGSMPDHPNPNILSSASLIQCHQMHLCT